MADANQKIKKLHENNFSFTENSLNSQGFLAIRGLMSSDFGTTANRKNTDVISEILFSFRESSHRTTTLFAKQNSKTHFVIIAKFIPFLDFNHRITFFQ